jgi:cytochrome c oxidase cbb3-type subunit 3
MSDFTSGFWSYYVAIVSLVSVIGCGVFLKIQSSKRPPMKKGEAPDLHGHTWDGDLQEYNNPMPRWWMWLFYLTIVFALGYLIYYPGLGSFAGAGGWTSEVEYQAEMAKADKDYGPLFEQYRKTDLAALAKDPKASAMGQRLFLNYCAQCHGSDARGAMGFPNLSDKDWLYGGDPQTIKTTILEGRNGVMPPMGDALGGEQGVKEMVQYVRSLSGLEHDARLSAAAAPKFVICAACHGAEGKGNRQIGSPNLTDKVWLYGSSPEKIAETIRLGRNNRMPAQKEFLGDAKVHLLAAFVHSLGGGEAPAIPAAVAAAK